MSLWRIAFCCFWIKFIGNIRLFKAISVIIFTAFAFNLFFIDKAREVVYNEKNDKILIDSRGHESLA